MTAAVATTGQVQFISASASSSYVTPEAVAAVDSRGRVHAAWVEPGNEAAGLKRARLWYSIYDPEMTRLRKSQLLDSSVSMYSLGLVIDDLDDVHIVWVSGSGIGEGPNRAEGVEADRPLNVVHYLTVDSNGSLLGSPKLILDSRADAVWVSITLGYESQLYLAWTEVLRFNSTDIESTAYYARLDIRDGRVRASGTLVARSGAPSRMLKTTASTDGNNLYLAWIDEIGQGKSRIIYTSVDLSRNVTEATGFEDVDGHVSRLALEATRAGEVVIGWAYQDPSHDQTTAHLAKLSPETARKLTSVDLQLPEYPAELESVSVDSQGNLHVVWVDVREDIRSVQRPIQVSQSSFYYLRLSSEGQPSEERSEVLNVPVVAAFVLEGGDLYAVSSDGLVQPLKPTSTTNPLVLLLALIVCVVVASGVNSEAAIYEVARLKMAGSGSNKKLVAGLFQDRDTRLLRKIRGHPGITLSELKSVSSRSVLDLASGLRILEVSGMIQSFREGTKRRFYSVIQVDEMKSRADELRQSILRLVEHDPGITEAHIAKRLVLSQQLANYHLKVLSEARLLLLVRAQGKVGYFLNERALARVRPREAG